MRPEQARDLFLYNQWANQRLLEAVSVLTSREFRADLGSSFPSVRDSLVHILSSEWLFLKRWNGVSPSHRLQPSDFPDVAAVRTLWREVEQGQREYLARLTPDALLRELAYVNTSGESWQYPLWQILQQVLLHSAYHRGQVTTMLRQLGHKPVETDLLTYYDQIPSLAAQT